MYSARISRLSCVLLFTLVFGFVSMAGPACVNDPDCLPAGSQDLFRTQPGTFFTLDGIQVPLMGRPIGPSGADTVVTRLDPVDVMDVRGSTQTVNAELTLLALQTTNPVNIGGSFFDIFVDLTPGVQSLGRLDLTQTITGEGMPEGIFTSFFDVFFTLDFRQGGKDLGCILPNGCNMHIQLKGSGHWTDDNPKFVLGTTTQQSDPNDASDIVNPVPEPSTGTLALSLLGLGVAFGRRKRFVEPFL